MEMERSIGLVLSFSGSGCKPIKSTEIGLPGKLPGKSIRKVETVIECHYNIGQVRVAGLPQGLLIVCFFFILIPRALALALITPHQGGHHGQIM